MEGAIPMANTNVSRRILVFVFPTEKAGQEFKDYSFEHLHTSQAQFTVTNSKVNKTRVLVRGTGSLLYDGNMKSDLMKYAEKLGGYLAKEVI